jgi:hypothetical protein
MAYHQLEPWGFEIDSFYTGVIASTIANVNRDPKKKPQPFTPQDFMLKTEKPETPAEVGKRLLRELGIKDG